MNFKLRLCSLILLVSMLFSLVSCGGQESDLPELDENIIVMSYGDYTINEKEFMYILTSVKTQFIMLYEYYYGYTEEQTMSLKIGDVTAADFIMDEAVKQAQKMLIIEKLADEEKISINNQDDIALINERMADIEYAYGGKDLFDVQLVKFGFTREGIERVERNAFLEELIVENRYGDNGHAKIPAETVNKEFLENFLAYEAGAFSYVNQSAAGYIKYDFSNDEILKFYSENYVRVRQILYSKENQSEAESDLDKLKNNEIEFSDILSKNQSVKHEFVFAEDDSKLGEKFEKSVFEMQIGDVKLVESDLGYHIVEKIDLDTSVFDGSDASSASAKDEVAIKMSQEKIRKEAESLKNKLNQGELKEFPEKMEGFSNYTKISINFLEKGYTEYKDRYDLISSLKVGEYGIYDSPTEGIYVYKRVDFSEKDITASIYGYIEDALIADSFIEYYSSYFDSIEIKNEILEKFDVITIPLLEDNFLTVN